MMANGSMVKAWSNRAVFQMETNEEYAEVQGSNKYTLCTFEDGGSLFLAVQMMEEIPLNIT